jgi:hypothetical protein
MPAITEITINDWTYTSYIHLMEYLYTGALRNLNKRVAMDLLGLSHTYILEGLKYLCGNTLMQNIDNESSIQILIVASKF